MAFIERLLREPANADVHDALVSGTNYPLEKSRRLFVEKLPQVIQDLPSISVIHLRRGCSLFHWDVYYSGEVVRVRNSREKRGRFIQTRIRTALIQPCRISPSAHFVHPFPPRRGKSVTRDFLHRAILAHLMAMNLNGPQIPADEVRTTIYSRTLASTEKKRDVISFKRLSIARNTIALVS